MKTSCLRLKLVELNFLVSFNTDDQSKTDVANTANVITYNLFVNVRTSVGNEYSLKQKMFPLEASLHFADVTRKFSPMSMVVLWFRRRPGKPEIVGLSPSHLTLFWDNIHFTFQIVTLGGFHYP